MKRLKKHASMLRALTSSSPNVSKAVIRAADKDLIHTLCECSQNILQGNVPLTNVQKRRLKRHKNTLRNLCKPQSLQKRKVLLQKGGFLGALLGPVIGILGSLLAK